MATEPSRGLGKITAEVKKAFEVERVPFRRNLTHEEMDKLAKTCSLAFRTEIDPQVIEHIMHYCNYVERNITGRAAGNIEDLIIRYLLRYYASFLETNSGKRYCHVEIGALFGAATIFSCHAVKLAKKEIVTVVIDPFEGYYQQDVDVVTHEKVDEPTFWSNIDSSGFDRDMVQVMKGLSANENIIKASQELAILSLMIDGDHSYDGVKDDWLNYSPQVVAGGLVLIDDYNNSAWPEVTEFVNKELISNLFWKWEVVLVYGNSLILKRTDLEENQGLSTKEIYYHRLNDIGRIIEKQNKVIEQKNIEIEEKEHQISTLHTSWSWKITAPLRWLVSKLK